LVVFEGTNYCLETHKTQRFYSYNVVRSQKLFPQATRPAGQVT